MKILFFTSPTTDYLSDPILIGLRKLYGTDCIDYPKRDILYRDCNRESIESIRGFGFTLYTGLLNDIDIDRFDIHGKLANKYFDLVIFSDIWRQFGFYLTWMNLLEPKSTIFLDGQDSDKIYPFAGYWLRNKQLRNLEPVSKESMYFKREFTNNSRFNYWTNFIPPNIKKFIPRKRKIYPISFSIPDEKIIKEIPSKTKMFTQHIVDEEIRKKLYNRKVKKNYVFKKENDYYNDLRISKYGITLKRAGWDCLRHYELAANACVPCFKNLNIKPITTAPHGLNNLNSICYSNYEDLISKLNNISDDLYLELMNNTLKWANKNSSTNRAKDLISRFLNFKKSE